MSRPTLPGVPGHTLMAEVRRRWWLPVGLALIGMCLSMLYAFTLGRSYESAATLTINPITSTLFATGPLAQQVDTATEATVMSSSQVLSAAAARLNDGTTEERLRDVVTVSVPGNSLALRVTADGDTAEQGAARANAVAESYLEYRLGQAQAQIDAFIKKVDTRISSLEKTAAAKSAAGVTEELVALRRSQSEAVTLVINPGTIVSPATPAKWAAWPRLLFQAAIGALFGFLIGLAYLAYRASRRPLVTELSDMLAASGDRPAAFAQEMTLDADGDPNYQREIVGAFSDEVLDIMSRTHPNDATPAIAVVGFGDAAAALQSGFAGPAVTLIPAEGTDWAKALSAIRGCDGVIVTATAGRTEVGQLSELHERVLRFRGEDATVTLLLVRGAATVPVA